MFQLKYQLPSIAEGRGQSTSAKISPDGGLVAMVQGTVILVYKIDDTGFAEFRMVVTSHSRSISDVCWSPDGKCVATASDDFTVEITHLSYGLIHRLVGHTAPVVSLCFNAKGNLLFSSSMDESIKIWDVLNGSQLRTIAAHSESVVSIDVPQCDGSVLSSGSYDGLIRIFDTSSGHCLKTLTYDKDWKSETGVVPISQVKFSANSKYLLVKSLDGVVKLWDCIRGYVVRTFKRESDDSQQLVHSCGMDFLYPQDDSPPLVVSGYETGDIYCWDSATKKLLYVLRDNERHRDHPIMSIDCKGNLMCSLSLNGECYLWDWVK
ncbi:hypothetical protein HG535_0H02840 [Zygotorulaspora mrakii]|uniref:Uncharacterized protein n=1 Tax=Zygotorulaspora mrakii TaxID=42260 RepID=A0A7H9B8L8_ZYGMR|nr:uncharacterized protein HG535_0H02840 [Zygotorulaspora mrakii]QLG74957.1 hypothetical protein HG535_0H02840 [Zygotorulaspora mrakii]